MALTTTPTFDAGTWFTENAAAIELVMEPLIDVNKQACPTLQILLAHKKEVELGPDGTLNWNFMHEMADVFVLPSFDQPFTAEALDPISRMQWSTVNWYGSAATNYQEMVRYGRQNRSRVDLIYEKVQAMYRGLTTWVNYGLFSDWTETATENIPAGEINLATELAAAPVPPTMRLRGITAHRQRFFSIPMLIREHATGHTIGNVGSDNALWRISATNGAVPTRNVTAADVRCDVVTAQGAPLTELAPTDIREHLNKVQRGTGYNLYCACPAELYGQLEDYLLTERQRQQSEEMHDIGIDAHFVYGAYNCIFYVEPMMTDLWPNTLFYYDPEVMFFVFDSAFNPWVVQWERIPGTPQFAMAAVWDGQLVTIDRRGISVQHGFNTG